MTIRFATISDKDAVLSLLDELIKQADLKGGSNATTLLSEKTLSTDWNRPEEDEAWASLQQAI